jgi:hypothetical protein
MKSLEAVFAGTPFGHAELLNKYISLSRSVAGWENKNEKKRGERRRG